MNTQKPTMLRPSVDREGREIYKPVRSIGLRSHVGKLALTLLAAGSVLSDFNKIGEPNIGHAVGITQTLDQSGDRAGLSEEEIKEIDGIGFNYKKENNGSISIILFFNGVIGGRSFSIPSLETDVYIPKQSCSQFLTACKGLYIRRTDSGFLFKYEGEKGSQEKEIIMTHFR